MAIGRKQIGWSQESNLLWEISRQMEKLTGVAYNSGGGGGLTSVTTDNFTILGNGTIPDPIFATGAVYTEYVDLALYSETDYTITKPGFYIVYDTSNTYQGRLTFDVTDPLDGQRITIINYQASLGGGVYTEGIINILTGGQGRPIFQGSTFPVIQIPSCTTYEFIFSSGTGSDYAPFNSWLCYNPQAPITETESLFLGDYSITNPGNYNFFNNENNNNVNLPNPANFIGLQIQITNSSGNTIPYATNQPQNANQILVTEIPPYTTHTLCALANGAIWQITNVYNSNVNVIDLSVSDYNIAYPGLYQVINADGGFQITISADQSIYNGQTITIINTDNIGYAPINTEGIVPSYQGTNTPITQLNSVSTYEFIAMDNYLIASTSGWFSKATTSVPAKEDIRLVVGIEPINLAVAVDGGGFYIINVANDAFSNGGVIIFPNPNEYKGQRVVIYNTDPTYDAPISLNGNEPIDIDGSTISLISPLTSYEFISTASNWWILNNRAI